MSDPNRIAFLRSKAGSGDWGAAVGYTPAELREAYGYGSDEDWGKALAGQGYGVNNGVVGAATPTPKQSTGALVAQPQGQTPKQQATNLNGGKLITGYDANTGTINYNNGTSYNTGNFQFSGNGYSQTGDADSLTHKSAMYQLDRYLGKAAPEGMPQTSTDWAQTLTGNGLLYSGGNAYQNTGTPQLVGQAPTGGATQGWGGGQTGQTVDTGQSSSQQWQSGQMPQQIAPTMRPVDGATESIEGRIQGLLARGGDGNYNNPVVRQAAEQATAQFAGRGLLNSSMAQESAYQAAIAKAIDIAGPDAQTYFNQGRANQDALNVFARDSNQQSFDMAKLDKTLQLDWAKLGQDKDQFDRQLAQRLTEMKMGTDAQVSAAATAHRNEAELGNSRSVQNAYGMYLDRLSKIDSDPNLGPEEKVKMKNEAGGDFDRYAAYYGVLNGMDLGKRFQFDPNDPGNSGKKPGEQGGGGQGLLGGGYGTGPANSGPAAAASGGEAVGP